MVVRYSSVPSDEMEAAENFTEEQFQQAPAPSGRKGKMAAAGAILLSLVALAAVVVVPSVRDSVTAFTAKDSSSPSMMEEKLMPSGELERRTGRKLSDGLFENLVRAHARTTLELKSGSAGIFYAESAPGSGQFTKLNDVAASSVEHVFTGIGKHQVKVEVEQNDGSIKTHQFRVFSKVIRVELRDLTEEDREIYFNALYAFQTTRQKDGEKMYGKGYKSLEYLLRSHLYGAADLACDHWHDDAGMITHHVGITWMFEQNLRTIDPRTASHYWDYTREYSRGVEWYNSNIFNDDWFGDNSPNNDLHILDTGRFAYSPVFPGRGFSDITNPYGLLRSPWNTNPTPYVLRYNKTFFHLGDAETSFPDCASFAATFNKSLAETIFALNGGLHGPVHIMIGGHWGAGKDWAPVGRSLKLTDKFLLLSKWLWRQGFVRVPKYCSDDTPHEDCMPTCPEGIVSSDLTNKEAYQMLEKTGILSLFPGVSDVATAMASADLGWADMWKELCHIGSAGDMFTSSAPQDPTFWPLHGNAERLVSLYRVLDKQGMINFDQTWGYSHSKELPSDTGKICDWSSATGTLDMPTCTTGICPGHKEDDLLPFTDLAKGQGSTLYTNAEFYELIDPYSEDMPYAYDSLSYWEGCEGHSIVSQYYYDNYGTLTAPDSHTTKTSTLWDSLMDGMWGVM